MPEPSSRRLHVVINEDNDHFFKFGPAKMTEAELRAYVDRYASYGVGAISFCTNGQRCSYRSDVLDAIWDPMADGAPPDVEWARCAQSLWQAGIDPYAVWIDECRKTGVRPWISVRMNDVHHTHPSLRFRADRRWFAHPEWTRRPEAFDISADKDWAHYQALQESLAWNYAHPSVRALMGAYLDETAERYDAEAFELDFSRDFFCLTPGRAREEADCLTALLRAFRTTLDRLARRRGHAIQLVVRVPWTPDIAAAWGFDVQTWATERLIDVVVPAPYWRSFQYDFPQDAWRAAVGADIRIIPAIDHWTCPSPSSSIQTMTAPFLRGWCGVMAAQGVDSVYLFNYPYRLDDREQGEAFRRLSEFGIDRILETREPRCVSAGYLDFPVEGVSCTSVFPITLTDADSTATVFLPFGNVPAGGRVTIRPERSPENGDAPLSIRLNGVDADADDVFPAAALRTGENEITLAGGPCTLTNLQLEWSAISGESLDCR